VGLLVLNAGQMSKGKLENVGAKDIQALMDVNMYQPTALLRKVLPKLLKRES